MKNTEKKAVRRKSAGFTPATTARPRRLVDNVKLLREEGIPIPETWRDALCALPADAGDPAACGELHRLLAAPEKKNRG